MTLDFGIDVATLPPEVRAKLAELELELSEGMTTDANALPFGFVWLVASKWV